MMAEVFIIKKYFLTLDPSLSLFLLPAALLAGNIDQYVLLKSNILTETLVTNIPLLAKMS